MKEADEALQYPIRQDLLACRERVLERLGGAGTWWTGSERLAIAAEARAAADCALCRERKSAISPYAVEGSHESAGELAPIVVDAIHRIRTDPGRLSRRWLDEVLAGGVSDAELVELIGVVVSAVGLDTFSRALGQPAEPLPAPRGGEPSRRRPASAKPGQAWVAMIAPEDAAGEEADLYGAGVFVPNIRRALSLVPDSARMLAEFVGTHYMPVDEMIDIARGRAIDRRQMELVAARVSALNGCFY
jgi:hypothetical protein